MPWCLEPGWCLCDLNNTHSLHRSQAAPQSVYFFLQLRHAVGNGRMLIFSLPQKILQLSNQLDRVFPLFADQHVLSSKLG